MEDTDDKNFSELKSVFGDRYSNYKFLSQGGMGKVFTAKDNILDKQIVIKILLSTFDDNHAYIRFQREAQTSSKLSHTNIVATLDFGITDKNFPYIVMDYIEGESLQEILDRTGQIDEETALQIVTQIARGMAYAHSKDIIHRDLKTANIIISNYPDAPHATIIDFGLAKRDNQVDSVGRLTKLGSIIGTPLYMSPEQARGQTGDDRSDIYSLGCILFKLLTGTTPFEGADTNTITIIQNKVKIDAPNINSLSLEGSFSQGLQELLSKSLSRNPDDRQQSMEVFLSELKQLEEEKKEAEEALLAASRMPKFAEAKKQKSTRIAMYAAVLIAIIGGIAFSNLMPRQEITPPVKVREFVQNEISCDKQWLEPIDTITLALVGRVDTTDDDLVNLEKKFKKDLCEFISESKQLNKNKNSALILNNSKVTGSGFQYLDSAIKFNYLDLTKSILNPKNLVFLKSRPEIQFLVLDELDITNSQLAYIPKNLNLKMLSIKNCKNLTDNAIDYIVQANFPLEKISLSGTKIGDEGVSKLAKMPLLEEIELEKLNISDSAIKSLSPLKKIQDLKVSNCKKLTGKSIRYISTNWPELKTLDLAYLRIEPSDLKPIQELKNLHFLNVMNIPVTDKEMAFITKNKNLRVLYLNNARITDKSLDLILGLPLLKTMSIYNTKSVSLEGLRKFKKNADDQNRKVKLTILTDKDSNLTIPKDIDHMLNQASEL